MGSYHNIEVQMEGYINIVIILVIMLSNLTKQKRAYYNDLIFFFIFLNTNWKGMINGLAVLMNVVVQMPFAVN